MAQVFDEARLPEEVEYGAHGGPSWQTTIVSLSSGAEQRNQDWSIQRSRYDIGYGIQNKTDYFAVLEFFYARRGRARGFRFKDWADFELENELIGTGDGAETTFQVIKTYESGGPHSYARKITRPIASGFQVFVNDILLVSGYTLDDDTGIITFAPAPGNTLTVRVTGEFDVPVRFDTDTFDMSIDGYQGGVIQSLPLIEIRE